MTLPRVEAWLYSELAGARVLSINEGAGAVALTLPSSRPLVEALEAWQALANASGSLARTDYAFSFDGATGLVTLASGAVFSCLLYEDAGCTGLASALGFSGGTLAFAASYTSDQQPSGIVRCQTDYTAPEAQGSPELRTFRWGKARAHGYHVGLTTRITSALTAAQMAAVQTGPLYVGKCRVYPHGFTSGKYESGNPRGYLDVTPCGDLTAQSLATSGTESRFLVSTLAMVV